MNILKYSMNKNLMISNALVPSGRVLKVQYENNEP